MPGLLRGRLPPAYHEHACELVRLIKMCLQFVITKEEIAALRVRFAKWVQEYERLYYRYLKSRLPACTLTIHILLHIADNILNLGPSWVYWTFWIERFSGWLKRSIESRRYPWANMNQRVLNHIYIEQLRARFDFSAEYAAFAPPAASVSALEHVYRHYPDFVLRSPVADNFAPDADVLKRIAEYYANIVGREAISVATMRALLPAMTFSWGKVRIRDGDSIRCAWVVSEDDEDVRDNTSIRFEREELKDGLWVPSISYGRLDRILAFKLPKDARLGVLSEQIRVVLVITRYATGGRDAVVEDVVDYQRLHQASVMVDLDGLKAAVGRFETRGKWVIVDRSGGMIKPEFVPEIEDAGEVIEA
ncbi:hypothetical protein MKEN_00010500 [Mycena kentingensis (nom. inval.)]|nr:hypothetical protein MKEN_00010500 [Mycena kentingensis (nom. inval.)]